MQTRWLKRIGASALGAACALAAPASAGAQINWVDWVSGAGTTATGTMNVGGTLVGVTYNGPAAFYQLGLPGETDYWRDGTGTPWPAYDGINAPTGTDMIALNVAGQHSLTFTSPVDGLFMAFVSVGTPTNPVTYRFSEAIAAIHSDVGWWSFVGPGALVQTGPNTMTGNEGHGWVRFDGSTNTLTWATTPDEYWHGFTVGATTVTPEPGTILLLGSGLFGVAVMARRRRIRR